MASWHPVPNYPLRLLGHSGSVLVCPGNLSMGFTIRSQARPPQQAFIGFVFLRAAISSWVALHTASRSVAVTLDYMTQNIVMTGTSTPLPPPLHGRTAGGIWPPMLAGTFTQSSFRSERRPGIASLASVKRNPFAAILTFPSKLLFRRLTVCGLSNQNPPKTGEFRVFFVYLKVPHHPGMLG